MALLSRRRTGFTTRASCLLAAGITAILCGLVLGETDLTRAGVLAAAIPCASAVIVHSSRVRVANRRGIEPAHASAGQSVTVHLTITNRSVLPTGALMLEDQLPERQSGRARFVLDSLGSHQARTVSYRMPTLGRGRYRAGPLRIKLSDPFHMIDLTRSFTATNEFVVTPVVDTLPPIEPPRSDELGDSAGSHSIGSHGADDASTREYRTGDDLRKIHWKSSARIGALMVRQEERPWRAQTTVLLDLRTSAHAASDDGTPGVDPRLTDSLEWAVSAAASIGTRAIRAGREVGLIAGDARVDRLRFGDAATLGTHLACVRESGDSGLNAILGQVRVAARESSLIAILGRLDPTALRLLADAIPRGRSAPPFAIMLDVDTWTEAADVPADTLADGTDQGVVERPWYDPAGPQPDADQDLRPAATEAAAGVLRGAGWRVVIARQGDAVPQIWQTLLSGHGPSARIAAVRR